MGSANSLVGRFRNENLAKLISGAGKHVLPNCRVPRSISAMIVPSIELEIATVYSIRYTFSAVWGVAKLLLFDTKSKIAANHLSNRIFSNGRFNRVRKIKRKILCIMEPTAKGNLVFW